MVNIYDQDSNFIAVEIAREDVWVVVENIQHLWIDMIWICGGVPFTHYIMKKVE